MAATEYEWVHEQGELDTRRVPVLDADGPKDVTGWIVDAKIKTFPGGTVLYTWPSQNVVVSGTDVDITILPAVSSGWLFERGWWRLKVTHPVDPTQAFRIVQGKFIVSKD